MRDRAPVIRTSGAVRSVLLLGACFAGACDGGTRVARDGTDRMADTLAAIHAQAAADPSRYPFLNRLRAEAIRGFVAGETGQEALQGRYLLASELLLAGQTREAISEFRALIQAAGVSLEMVTPATKPLFDLLAVAYLRLGEQENCLDNPAASVCILPLDTAARHTRDEGAREAIRAYEALLERFPEDYGSRWLLNLAYMAIGGYPDLVPARHRIPGLTPRPSATFPRFTNIAGDLGLGIHGLSGGLSVEDFNRDGSLDLFMTSWGFTDPVRLFLADGRGGFADHTAAAGLERITGGLNTVHADYDNDGYPDILVLRGAWLGDAGTLPNSLLRNRGDGTFEDVTFTAGLLSFHPTQTAAWADFNLDGHLDLFIGNESARGQGGGSHRSELFLNNGDGTFTEVSRRVGIDLDEMVKGVVWGDVNNDGLPDLYVSILGGPNRLYINRGGHTIDTWRFEEAAEAAGVQLPIHSFPVWFWDYDQDGWEDLLVLSYDIRHSTALHEAVAREYLGLPLTIMQQGGPVAVEPSRLFRNNGDGTFTDVTRQVGLDTKVLYPMGSNFGDLDNDGWLDFYLGTGNPDLRSVIPNRMFRNVQGRRFEEVTLEGGFGHIQKGHGVAFADLDRDGDLDIYMVMGGAYEGDRFANVLFENPGWPEHHWIVLELEGRAANRSAIGARVEVVAVEPTGRRRTLHRTVGTGGSFGAGPLQLHVGLGRATRVERVGITWPDSSRSITTYGDLAIRQAWRIVQGEDPQALHRPPTPFRKAGTAGHEH